MIKSSKPSSKVQQRDFESELLSSAQTIKRAPSKTGKSILSLQKRQKTSPLHSAGKCLSQLKKRQETEKEASGSKQSSLQKSLSIASSPPGIVSNIQKKNDTQIQEGDSRHNKTPSTSYSQPSLYQGSHMQGDHQVTYSQKASANLISSGDSIKAATTKQKLKTKEITTSQFVTPNNDQCDSINSHNTESSSLDVDMRKPCKNQKKVLSRKKDSISSLKKKPLVKLLEKKQQKEKKLFSNSEDHLTSKFYQLLKAIEYIEYQDHFVIDGSFKNKEQLNSDVKNSQVNLHFQDCEHQSPETLSLPLGSQEDQAMDSGDQHNSPLMINPNNPIRDPQTKKRLRACANVICGFKSYGGEASFWSRRKFSKGKFFWLCKVCSEAYNKNQYCCFCKQIYFDTAESAVSDGKEWIQCECCFKWNHTECEIQNGNSQVQEETQNQQDSEFQYFCPSCLKKKQNKQSSDIDSSQSSCSDHVKMSSPKGKSHVLNLEESDQELQTPMIQKLSTTCSSLEEQKQNSQELQNQKSLQRKVISKAAEPLKPTGKSTPTLKSSILQQLTMSSVQTRNGKQSVILGKKF